MIPNQSLVEQVRSEVERTALHPAAVQVQAVREGEIELSGPVLDREVGRLLRAVGRVPEVREVRQRFDVISSGKGLGLRHRPEDSFGYQAQFLVSRWPIWARVILGSASLGLIARSLKKRGKWIGLGSGLGLTLLSRALTNRDITQLFGSLVLPVIRMRRTIEVAAPIETAYEFWNKFSNYPKFMSFIREVRVNSSGGLKWKARAPGGAQVSWDTTLLNLTPHQRIAWKSVPSSVIATEGVVQMMPVDSGHTRILVELSYIPPAGALGFAAASLVGLEPKRRMDEDLEVMRVLIETEARQSWEEEPELHLPDGDDYGT